MAFEIKVVFLDAEWYKENKENIAKMIAHLPTYTGMPKEYEYWLKDDGYNNQWDYDVRIFLNSDDILFEVTSFSKAFSEDIKFLYDSVQKLSSIQLIDDDGETYYFK